MATLDTAIGNLEKALVRDTRKQGTNDWASRLEKGNKRGNMISHMMGDICTALPPMK